MQLSDRAGDIGSESIVIQNLLGTTASMVDTIMIGSQGELAVAAVGICSQISSLYFNSIVIGDFIHLSIPDERLREIAQGMDFPVEWRFC